MNLLTMLRSAIPLTRVNSLGTAAVLALTLAAAPGALAQDTDTLPTRVARLSNLSGEIYLATQENSEDWSPVQLNYPVTSGDNLWAAQGARAEVEFGGSQVRISSSTNVNVANLDERNMELFVAQGSIIVRLSILDAGDSAVIDTPTTQVVLVRPGLYRIDVSPDQQQTTLTVRAGEATAQVTAGLQQVLPGMSADIANGPTTVADFSAAYPFDAFDTWSAERERYFRQGGNTTYVSQEMVGYADLARYGAWQSNPDYGNVWYPSNVAPGWAPYSDGYWTTVSGFGLTWVDRAPWGYAPFHYGRWTHIRGRWGWLPGTYVARPVWAPALVAWTGGEVSIGVSGGAVYGWVPLGWSEPYRPWWNGCGASCWDRYNRPYHVDERDHDRYRDHAPPPERYANWHVPGAVSAVAGANLIARKPYAGNERIMALTGSQLPAAHVADSAPPIAKPSPGRIPTVRPGARGTPPPASTFYTTSKPAQMGLQHRDKGRLQGGKPSASQTILNATGIPAKPNAQAPNNRADRGPGSSRSAQVPLAQPNARDNAEGRTSAPPASNAGRAGRSPRAATPNNAATPGVVTPPPPNNVAPSSEGNARRRVQTEPGANAISPRKDAESKANNKPPLNQAERAVTPPPPRLQQPEARVVNPTPRIEPPEPAAVNQPPRVRSEQRVPPQQGIRMPPPPPPVAARSPASTNVAPQQATPKPNAARAAKANEERDGRRGERDNNNDNNNKEKDKQQ